MSNTTLDDFITLLNKNIEWEFNISKNIGILSDTYLFSTVIRNLLSNAIKHSNTNGKIVVSITNEEDNWLFSIQNTGEQISRSILNELQTKKKKQIKGMGLFLCLDFLEKMGATLKISYQNQMNTFSFQLPKHELEDYPELTNEVMLKKDEDSILLSEDSIELLQSILKEFPTISIFNSQKK